MKYLFVALALISSPAFSDTVLTPGTDCAGIIPTQTRQLEWREIGLINPLLNKDFFVICPFERQTEADGVDNRFWGGALVLANLPDGVASQRIRCEAREVVAGEKVWSNAQTVTVRPNSQTFVRWPSRRVADVELSTFHATCLLKPRTAIATILSASTGSPNNAALQSLAQTLPR